MIRPMSEARGRGVFRLALPAFVLLQMGGLLLYASGGRSIACVHGEGGTTCVVSRRLFKLVDVPVRRVSGVQAATIEERQVPDEDGNLVTVPRSYLVTAGGKVSLRPPGDRGADAETVATVDAFCKDGGAPPLTLHHQDGGGAFALHLLAAFMVLWGAALVVEAMRAKATGRPSTW
jgi:hypothetical protein